MLKFGGKNYSALDAKALALCRLALCEDNAHHITDAISAFRAEREITRAEDIVRRVGSCRSKGGNPQDRTHGVA